MMSTATKPLTHHDLTLQVPPDARHARTVRSAIEGFASLYDVSRDDLDPLLLAVGEAVANAIEHAATNEDLEVIAEIGATQIRAIVIDHGKGLPATPEDHHPLPGSLVERGRGISIMQRCTHRFGVVSSPGRGTRVELIRNLSRREEQASSK